MGSDGKKLSKSLGNFTDPNIVMDQYSADALRFTLLASPVVAGEDVLLKDKEIADTQRKLAMVWNMYDFFTLYADVDDWEWNGKSDDPSSECTNPLDTWIVSRMHQLVTEVGTHMDHYDLQNAVKPILPFIDDASNWYVRRSRKRFWKSGDDADKHMAYRTLHYVLVQLAHVMAPFTPFMAEELYRNLTGGESVHLNDWPVAGHVNELVLGHMNAVRTVINDGLSQRASAGIKVRQPLASAKIRQMYEFDSSYDDIVSEELNVKQVLHEARKLDPQKDFEQNLHEQGLPQVEAVELDLDITPELHREGMMREVIRAVQNARKEAGLEVDDRINLSLQTDIEQLQKAITEHKDTIVAETLAHDLQASVAEGFTKTVKIEGHELTLHLKKA